MANTQSTRSSYLGALALMMVGVVAVHLRRGDGVQHAIPAIVLGVLAVIVAAGRFGPEQF